MAFHLNNKESRNKWEVAFWRRTRVFEMHYLWFLHTTITFVSFNFEDESDVAKRFALQTSHCALQWYEILYGYGKMDGVSLECLLQTSTRRSRICSFVSIPCRNLDIQIVLRCQEGHKCLVHFTEDSGSFHSILR